MAIKDCAKRYFETARGLYDLGVVDAGNRCAILTLRACHRSNRTAAAEIKRLRLKAKASQAVFAAYLNTSVSTVQKWEIGDKKPSGPALKLPGILSSAKG